MKGKMEEPEENFEFIFESNLSKMRKYVDIPSGSKIEKEVKSMTGMGMSIYERGIEQGIERGIEQGKADSVRKMLKKVIPVKKLLTALKWT